MGASDTGEVSDAVLVVEVGRFAERALAEIYRRHGAAVYGLARRVLRDEQQAEEITQEVFLRLWERPERFDPTRGSLRSFLLAQTHGRAVDRVRAEAARRAREEREATREVSVGPDLEREALQRSVAGEVRDALGSLADGERRAIELAYLGGYTYREVASLLGEPEGTVKSRIRAGLGKLRKELVDLGGGAVA